MLASGTIHFPKRLRQVAIFLWQHPSDVAVGTISQVAEQAGVQPSTLVRFAQIFGYAGFSDFQALFKEHVKGSWPDGPRRGRAGRAAPTCASSAASSPPRRPRSPASASDFDAASFERDGRPARRGRAHPRHRQQARLPGHRLRLAGAVAAGREERARRQRRLDRARPDRLHRPARRGARRELQPLQLDHARPRRDGARARRPHRRHHRQHLQPAGQALRRLGRGRSNPISPASARSPPRSPSAWRWCTASSPGARAIAGPIDCAGSFVPCWRK